MQWSGLPAHTFIPLVIFDPGFPCFFYFPSCQLAKHPPRSICNSNERHHPVYLNIHPSFLRGPRARGRSATAAFTSRTTSAPPVLAMTRFVSWAHTTRLDAHTAHPVASPPSPPISSGFSVLFCRVVSRCY